MVGFKKLLSRQAPVAHTCNPNYSGGRDQENRGIKSLLGKQFLRPKLEKTHHNKRAGGVAQGVGPEFKTQYWKEGRIVE
jgi:hypothetical protein